MSYQWTSSETKKMFTVEAGYPAKPSICEYQAFVSVSDGSGNKLRLSVNDALRLHKALDYAFHEISRQAQELAARSGGPGIPPNSGGASR